MSDTSQGDGWWQASDGKFYPPESRPAPPLPPPPTAAATEPESKGLLGRARGAADKYQDKAETRAGNMARKSDEKQHGASSYTISEGGKNGSVKFEPGRLERTIKKTIGRDDTQTIPFRAITSTSLDRRRGRSIITLVTAGNTFVWKISRGAEFEAELNEAMYGD